MLGKFKRASKGLISAPWGCQKGSSIDIADISLRRSDTEIYPRKLLLVKDGAFPALAIRLTCHADTVRDVVQG